ncbi:MAG: signal peptidase I [Thermoleophilia bacterium]|nr:signal peptidase I [Thermoleophilia bacterium]
MRFSRVGSRRQEGSSLLGSLVEIVVIVGAAFILALLIQQFVVKPFYIPSESMEDTLVKGDRVLVNRFIYRFSEPERGDVVVFHPPTAPQEDYIKRIVAVGGQTVAVHDGKLYVDGEPQDEPYVKNPSINGTFPEREVPEGSVFMMGDNRNQSGDSRVFGPVEESRILGKAFMVYWPPGKIGGL